METEGSLKSALQQTGKSFAKAAAEIGCSKPMLVAVVNHGNWPKKNAAALREKLKDFFKQNGADIPASLRTSRKPHPSPTMKARTEKCYFGNPP